ncbi:MAG: hypothetical protein ACK4N5_20370, partial [Myxococcales bacterium]
VSVEFLDPVTLSSPPHAIRPRSEAEIPHVARAALDFSWTSAPEADLVVLDWRAEGVRATVYAPGGAGTFKPVELPAALAAPAVLRVGLLKLELASGDFPEFDYRNFLSGEAPSRDGQRTTELDAALFVD